MARYVVNDNTNDTNGDHEVHVDTCHLYPLIVSYAELGQHSSCQPAVAKALTTHSKANGCIHCCTPCHNG